MKRWLCLVALAACDLPEVELAGEHVRVAVDPELEPCGGTLAHMDDFITRAADALGVAAPTGDDRLVFYWLGGGDFFTRSPCPEGSDGCQHGRELYARSAPLDHELVHALAESLADERLPLFTEGLAVAFEGLGIGSAGPAGPRFPDVWGEPHEPSNPVGPRVDEVLLLRDPLAVDGFYPLAGAFTSHLIARHGLPAYLRVYAAARYRIDRGELDAVFRGALGVSLAQAIADFEARAACPWTAASAKLSECSARELEWDGATLELHRTLSCAQDDVIGPYHGDDTVVLHTLVVPTDGSFELAVIGDGPSGVALQQCGGCEAQASLISAARFAPITATLPAGRYSLRLLGPAPETVSLGFRLRRIDMP